MMEPSPQLHGALQTVVLALQHSSFWTDVRDLLIVRSINAGRLVGGGRLPSGLRLLLVLLVVLVVLVVEGRGRETGYVSGQVLIGSNLQKKRLMGSNVAHKSAPTARDEKKKSSPGLILGETL